MKIQNPFPARKQLIHQVLNFCFWVESQDGWYSLLHRDERDYLGHVAQSRLTDLRVALFVLLIGWSEEVVIDLTEYQCALDAYREVMGAVWSIEERQGLPKDTLAARVFIIDQSSVDSPEYRKLMAQKEARLVASVVGKVPSPLNQLQSAFGCVGL